MAGVPYRLDPGRPVGEELRRVIGDQLRAASTALGRPDEAAGTEGGPSGPDDEAIHSARKHIKKARSALRLARADLGPAIVKHAQAELRDCADRLSAQRDLDSQAELGDLLVSRTEAGTEDHIFIETLRVLLRAEAAEARE